MYSVIPSTHLAINGYVQGRRCVKNDPISKDIKHVWRDLE